MYKHTKTCCTCTAVRATEQRRCKLSVFLVRGAAACTLIDCCCMLRTMSWTRSVVVCWPSCKRAYQGLEVPVNKARCSSAVDPQRALHEQSQHQRDSCLSPTNVASTEPTTAVRYAPALRVDVRDPHGR